MVGIWEFISTILGRVLAAWLAGLCTYLAVKWGIVIDSDTQRQFVEHLVGIIIPLLLTLYSIFHKVFNKKLNPGDAASTHLAEREKAQAATLKR